MTQAGSADDLALEALRFGWGDAYEIGYDEERGHWALRRDGLGGHITAPDAEKLRDAVVADYDLKRVPRDIATLAET